MHPPPHPALARRRTRRTRQVSRAGRFARSRPSRRAGRYYSLGPPPAGEPYAGPIRNTGWRGASAANASTRESGRTSKYGRVMLTLVTYVLSTGALWAGPSSVIGTTSDVLPRARVTRPAALAFWTHATSPYGATSQRFPPSITSETGVERASPLLRPVTVSTWLFFGPIPNDVRPRAIRFTARVTAVTW